MRVLFALLLQYQAKEGKMAVYCFMRDREERYGYGKRERTLNSNREKEIGDHFGAEATKVP